jgi:hypothetical protein
LVNKNLERCQTKKSVVHASLWGFRYLNETLPTAIF